MGLSLTWPFAKSEFQKLIGTSKLSKWEFLWKFSIFQKQLNFLIVEIESLCTKNEKFTAIHEFGKLFVKATVFPKLTKFLKLIWRNIFYESLSCMHSVEKREILSQWIFFRQINSLVKTLLSRNFCEKVWERISAFSTLCHAWWWR